MSKSIDQRIVEMQFNNRQFESGVKESLGSLDKLKKGLDLNGASKGLTGLGDAAKRFSLAGIASGVDTIAGKFSMLGIIGVTALQNITNSAINAGKTFIKSLTIDPVMQGFREYETQMNAIQTVLANTSSKGTTLDQVNAALNELNIYSDKTIYNFTQMAKNIGTFTAAGVELKVATSAIKGIANLAAVSGSNADQASTAMYQLSQAMASGTVKLMDWNSVVNAGMGGQVFQDSLKETARVHGINIDQMIKANGSFRETLQAGWLTTDVLTETLSKFTGDLNASQLKGMGYTEKQIAEVMKLGDMANKAATEVKTLTQLTGTLQEAAQSGWTKSWQLMVGDFGEAKTLFTNISNVVGGIIGASAKARNDLLSGGLSGGFAQFLEKGVSDKTGYIDAIKTVAKSQGIAIDDMIKKDGSFEATLKSGWLTSDIMGKGLDTLISKTKGLSNEQLTELGYSREQADALAALGVSIKNGSVSLDEFAKKMLLSSGRENIITGLSEAFKILIKVLTPIKEAFNEIFPAYTGEQLYNLTQKFRDLITNFKIGEETLANLKSTFKGLFAILDIAKQAFFAIAGGVGRLIKILAPASSSFLDFTAGIGEWFVGLDAAIKKGDVFNKGIQTIADVLELVSEKIRKGISAIIECFTGFGDVDLSGVNTFTEKMRIRFEPFTSLFEGLGKILSNAVEILKKVAPLFYRLAGMVGDAIMGLQERIINALNKGDFNTILDLINTGLLGGLILGIKKFVKSMTDATGEFSGTFSGIKGVLDGVRGSLEAYQSSLKAGIILKIAIAIGILAVALALLASLDSVKLTFALGAITTLFIELFAAMSVFTKMMGGLGLKGMGNLVVLSGAMIAMSVAVLILTVALAKLAELDWGQITKGLVAVGALMGMLVLTSKLLSANKGTMIKGAVGFIIFAVAINILASAVKKLGEIDIKSLAKGLAAVGIVMTELALFMKVTDINKMGIAKGIGILLLAVAINVLASAVKKLGEIDIASLTKGLMALGILLTEITLFIKMIPDAKGFITTAIGLTILGAAMYIFAIALEKMGSIPLAQIGKGLLAMAGSLAIITLALRFMPTNMVSIGVGMLAIATALLILSKALETMGGMTWEEIAKGLIVLAGSLTIITIAMQFMQKALPGAAALFVVSFALVILAKVLQTLGSMSLAEIGKSLLALAGVFILLGIASVVLGPLIPVILSLAGAIALLGIGLLAIGAGLLLFSMGLTALAVAGAAGTAALVALITAVVGLIPYLLEQIGLAIIAFAGVIIEGMPVIMEAIGALFAGLIKLIGELTPPLILTVLNFILELLTKILEYTPKFVDTGMKIIIAFLQGIAKNIAGVVKAGIDIILNFLEGIRQKLPAVIDMAFKLIIAFINGLATAIRNNNKAIYDAVENLITAIIDAFTSFLGRLPKVGGQIVSGLIKGVTSMGSGLVDAVKGVANNAVNGLKKLLGIKSPSTVFAEIGRNTGKGMIIGLKAMGSKIATTAGELGTKAVNAMSNALSNVQDALNSDVELQPTIRPVIDMTDVESGLNSTFSKQQGLNVEASVSKVSTLTAQRQNGSDSVEGAQSTTNTDASKINIVNNYNVRNDNDIRKISQDQRNLFDRYTLAKGVPVTL